MTFTTVGKDRRPRVVGLLAALALFTAGCYKATGGGWIPSMTGAYKASFGFSVKCDNDTLPDGTHVAALYEGQLEWYDGPVRFHGDVDWFDTFFVPGNCKDARQLLVGKSMQFGGTYWKPGGAGGFFIATVIDNGTPGANGDFIQIQLIDGVYNGYFNEGFLQGGNIQVF